MIDVRHGSLHPSFNIKQGLRTETAAAEYTMSLLLAFSWLVLLLLVSLLLVSTKRVKRSKLQPPSPPKFPLIGNLHQLGSLPHRSLRALARQNGPLMLLHLGHVPTIVVSSMEVAREIMTTHDLVFASRPSLKAAKILLYGCTDMAFSPYGDRWRQLRKVSNANLLSSKRVQSFRPAREEEVALMIKKISSSPTSPANVTKILNSFANDIICRVVCGKFAREDRNEEFGEVIEENLLLLDGFHLVDYFPSLECLSTIFGWDKRAIRNSKRWDVLLDQIIEDHANGSKDDACGGVESGDFVDILLSLQKDPDSMDFVLTHETIKALILDMIAAGSDTTFVTLVWAMAELIKHPEAMKKLQTEVRAVATDKALIREEDLSEMNYLKAVIKEILRLHPPAPLLLPRESTDDCRVDGYEIPKQTRVIVNAWAISRDARFWDSPEEFQPERFLESPVTFKGSDFQYIPFGAGRRICPGMQFASASLELALGNLIRCFDWGLPDGLVEGDLDMSEGPGVTAHMKHDLYLVARPVRLD